VALARREPIASLDGAPLRVTADTLCLHGDTPDAAARARAVRDALAAAGIRLAASAAT
jgi:5-oxoprolinase (ATP-hydrolysing) subunit A